MQLRREVLEQAGRTRYAVRTPADAQHHVGLPQRLLRPLGELGIGCNPGITRYMKNTLFDEKMNGTVHLAVGNSYTDVGGVNQSAIHWDLVKDLRLPGSRIELDGVVVQDEGAWLVF